MLEFSNISSAEVSGAIDNFKIFLGFSWVIVVTHGNIASTNQNFSLWGNITSGVAA